jgi:hypothetical protein
MVKKRGSHPITSWSWMVARHKPTMIANGTVSLWTIPVGMIIVILFSSMLARIKNGSLGFAVVDIPSHGNSQRAIKTASKHMDYSGIIWFDNVPLKRLIRSSQIREFDM